MAWWSRLSTGALLATSLIAASAQAATPWGDARQAVVVTTPDWDTSAGRLRRFERRDGTWRQVGPAVPVQLGRNGSAWGLGLHPRPPAGDAPVKREGDGRSPAGIFAIGEAFGYASRAATDLPYLPMLESNYCIDVRGSPLYNRIVDAAQVGHDAVEGSTEPMRLDLHNDGDQRYKWGFVIAHNPDNRDGAGSCIFAHLWKDAGTPTAGCTAMPEPAMERLLDWLQPTRRPMFVLLPDSEYARLQAPWRLPAIVGTASTKDTSHE
ncbi:hypothetical protein L3V18_15275 [Lysobacter sp. TLK-CK17T]|uniref:L,D-peptidoglycan transpeptidase YkuD (ErfK/YbiS/YcfS/YnhG family) n=1 Tax=Marilutibacter chinensis TaxID=2912247 RepID=A0ABS9HWJ3_9GAMM|nr:hypothetical protein [Lysobacter chinensis]MCF7223138.1 hypothetical protein [Lysobacter chinensis]